MGNSSAFNSKNPFALHEPSYNSEQYSGSFCGPIGRKASFFVNAERRNISDDAVVNAYVLGPAPGFIQQPYNTAVLVPRTRTNLGPRVDYQITPNNTLTARYQYWNAGAKPGRRAVLTAEPGLQLQQHRADVSAQRHADVRRKHRQRDAIRLRARAEHAAAVQQ